MKRSRGEGVSGRLVGVVTFALVLMVCPTAAGAQTPMPLSPNDGHVFSWEDVEVEGVELVVQGPPSLVFVQAEVSRDASFATYGETVLLDEGAPGHYRGWALDLLYDERNHPGLYFWRPYYYGGLGSRFHGPAREFSIKAPYRAPALRIVARPRIYAARRSPVVLHYRAGSESQADRLSLIAASRCPSSPGDGARGSVVSYAEPPLGGQLAVAIRRPRIGRIRLCAYVTAGGVVTRRATRMIDIVKPPASRRQMLRWRLSARGLGPIRIGMTIGDIERVTGRSAVKGYGDFASCQIWSLRGAPGLSLMRAYGRLVRVEAYRGRWRTARRVGIGDPVGKVFARYGGIRTEPHPYTTGKYLIVGGPKRRMIFETNSARMVTSFRGGHAPQVGYIEGCA